MGQQEHKDKAKQQRKRHREPAAALGLSASKLSHAEGVAPSGYLGMKRWADCFEGSVLKREAEYGFEVASATKFPAKFYESSDKWPVEYTCICTETFNQVRGVKYGF